MEQCQMSSQYRPVFTCPECGRTDTWTEALAGQVLRCPCGQRFTAPASEPAMPAPEQVPVPMGPTAEPDEFADLIPVAPEAPRPAARSAGHASSMPHGQATERSPSTSGSHTGRPHGSPTPHQYAADPKSLVKPLMLMVLLLSGGIGLYAWLGHSQPPQPAKPGEDDRVEKLIAEKGAKPVSPWLAEGPQHTVRGMEAEVAKSTERELINRGAVQVLALGRGVSEFLVVELPTDPEVRDRVFAWAAGYDKTLHRTDLAPFSGDSGQRYLLLRTPDEAFAPVLR